MESLEIEKNIKIVEKDALLVIDVQNDFIPGGTLPVEEGDLIIDGINQIASIFKNKKAKVIFTQDWHPKDHKSFASQHEGKKIGDAYQTEGIGPILWPDHCVQGTIGAEFHEKLQIELADAIIQKGMNPEIDSYSGFLDNDKKTKTNLDDKLKDMRVERVFICGLALDYCCFYTAIDAIDFGFNVYFIIDLTKGIDLPEGNIAKSLETMRDKGIKFTNKENLF